ncbi:MAG TPA: hypothetical protein VN767_26700 [Streptosporangiaceae bacterium]|nr:hypothetical protein [Streptosporangiaceae bacterium]
MTIRTPRIKPVLQGIALAAAAVTAMGSGAAALAAPAGPSEKAADASLVPLSKVGLGWSVAEYTKGFNKHPAPTTLYAVSPQGKKFPFFTWPASDFGTKAFYLVDWSGDGQRVLVRNFFNKFEQISLVTGKVINTFKLPADAQPISYTRPSGQNILASNGNKIVRYDLSGHLTKVLNKKTFEAIESPDGTSVILSAKSGLGVVSNSGGPVKLLPAPAGVAGCSPVRWWNSTTILADCEAKHGPSAPRLWLFPENGGKVKALTAQRSKGPDLGDINAYKLTSGTFLEALGPCGVEFIAKQSANGSAHQVVLPGVRYPSDLIITGQGSTLLVQASGGCSAGAALVLFNPHTKKVSWIFHPTGKSYGAEVVVPFGRPLS